MFQAVPHSVTRLDVGGELSFDDLVARYESAVPTLAPPDLARLLAASRSWDELVEATGQLAPHGFLLYARIDVEPVMRLAGHRTRAIEYLMGNHIIAETMFRHDPGVMLYAPLRTLIYEDEEGNGRFSIDQPSTRFASFSNAAIADGGTLLDRKLFELLSILGLPTHDMLH